MKISKAVRTALNVAIVSFLVSLVLSSAFAYFGTEVLTESRKSVLVKALSQNQVEDSGFFRIIVPYVGTHDFNTADALYVIRMLDATDSIDVEGALRFLASTQYNQSTGVGGFGARYENGSFVGCDLYSTYHIVTALSMYNALDRINETSLFNFILNRYNDTIGAFHELVTEVDGKEYAGSTFPLVFRSFMSHIAYGMPNIITTFAGVCVLKRFDRLDLINTTKTFEWIMHCQAENGMFKPYPDGGYMPLPDWSPLKTNPFEVDRYGTGIPYTFAAISALKALGRLDAVSASVKQKTRDYIRSCQINRTDLSGLIFVHRDYDYEAPSYTYEATMILHYLGMSDESDDIVTRIVDFFQRIQTLHLDNSWPVPYPSNNEHTVELYGLHYYEGPPTDSYYAVAVFNATGNMHLLDQPTPRVRQTWLNLIELSTLVTAVTTSTLAGVLWIKKRRTKTMMTKTS